VYLFILDFTLNIVKIFLVREGRELTGELYELFSSFPNSDQVEKFCQPGKGKKTCRYLTVDKRGFGCAMTGILKKNIDKRVEEGEMVASSINCEGVLGLVLSRQEGLKGNKIIHKETMPNFQIEGVFQEMKTENGQLFLIAHWKGEGMERAFYKTDSLNIEVKPHGITFGISGLRTFYGETTIFFR